MGPGRRGPRARPPIPREARAHCALREGGRVFVRFDHGDEPIAWWVVRGVRQMVLRAFNA